MYVVSWQKRKYHVWDQKKEIINVQINDSLLKCTNNTSRDERGSFIYLKKCVVFVCTCERKEEFFFVSSYKNFLILIIMMEVKRNDDDILLKKWGKVICYNLLFVLLIHFHNISWWCTMYIRKKKQEVKQRNIPRHEPVYETYHLIQIIFSSNRKEIWYILWFYAGSCPTFNRNTTDSIDDEHVKRSTCVHDRVCPIFIL